MVMIMIITRIITMISSLPVVLVFALGYTFANFALVVPFSMNASTACT